MIISFCSHLSGSEVIAMKFCTWHDRFDVVACGRVFSDIILCNGVAFKPIFYRIWITIEQSSVKWASGLDSHGTLVFHSRSKWNGNHFRNGQGVWWLHPARAGYRIKWRSTWCLTSTRLNVTGEMRPRKLPLFSGRHWQRFFFLSN